MALNKDTLTNEIKGAFAAAQSAKKADGESDDAFNERLATILSDKLAQAVENYVKGGRVAGISVSVRDPNGAVIGTGTQTAAVALS